MKKILLILLLMPLIVWGNNPKNKPANEPPATITIVVGNITFEMVHVDGGSYIMGASEKQRSIGYRDETPAHAVKVNSYYMGRYEVTQKLWQEVMGYNPSNFIGDDLPVEQVNYYEVQEFLRRINERTGLTFRLPTEAEWEYAARGGKKSRDYIYAGNDDHQLAGWSRINSHDSTHWVGMLVPNELGLYDMSGNVWEWCSDHYSDYYYVWCCLYHYGIPEGISNRKALYTWANDYGLLDLKIASVVNTSSTASVIEHIKGAEIHDFVNPQGPDTGSCYVGRGGSWTDEPKDIRTSYRNYWVPEMKLSVLGFRLVLSDNETTASGWMPNQYLIDSIAGGKIYMSSTPEDALRMTEGVLPGVFSVSPTKQVRFSKGNLQYNDVNKAWRFADEQWSTIGLDNVSYKKVNPGWIDLFAWATSGYREKTPTYFSANPTYYGNGNKNIDGSSFDWGVYNRISNGGNQAGRWRTLTVNEWAYLLLRRPDAEHLAALATIGDEGHKVEGMLLLPDDWLQRGLDTLKRNYSYTISAERWQYMQRAGAVFLPAGGYCKLNQYYISMPAQILAPPPNAYIGPMGGGFKVEGYNATFGRQFPMTHESVSQKALESDPPDFGDSPVIASVSFVGDMPYTAGEISNPSIADMEFASKASAPPPVNTEHLIGYYWTSIHHDARSAIGYCFFTHHGGMLQPLERDVRAAVRLVQDVEE